MGERPYPKVCLFQWSGIACCQNTIPPSKPTKAARMNPSLPGWSE